MVPCYRQELEQRRPQSSLLRTAKPLCSWSPVSTEVGYKSEESTRSWEKSCTGVGVFAVVSLSCLHLGYPGSKFCEVFTQLCHNGGEKEGGEEEGGAGRGLGRVGQSEEERGEVGREVRRVSRGESSERAVNEEGEEGGIVVT